MKQHSTGSQGWGVWSSLPAASWGWEGPSCYPWATPGEVPDPSVHCCAPAATSSSPFDLEALEDVYLFVFPVPRLGSAHHSIQMLNE